MTNAKVDAVPPQRSPLEIGRWYTKAAFERQDRVGDWRTMVCFTHAGCEVRCGGIALIGLLREHAGAYFQLVWNTQPASGTQEICVGTGKRQQWRPYQITYAPGTTIRLRICYALTPQQDTEIVLHDGYGLPTRDPWWRQMTGTVVALPVPARRVEAA